MQTRISIRAASLVLLALLAALPACKEEEQPPAAVKTPPPAATPHATPATPPAAKPAPRASIQSSTPAAPATPATPPAVPAAKPAAPQAAAQAPEPAADPMLPPVPTISSNFPYNRVYSRTQSTETAIQPGSGPLMESGSGVLAPLPPGAVADSETTVKGIKAPNQFTVVQLPLAGDYAYTYLKAAMNMAANLSPIFVEDDNGQTYPPVGYMIPRASRLEFKLDPENPMRAVTQIPGVKNIQPSETIWLIFYIPKNTRLTKFSAARKTLNLDLAVR